MVERERFEPDVAVALDSRNRVRVNQIDQRQQVRPLRVGRAPLAKLVRTRRHDCIGPLHLPY